MQPILAFAAVGGCSIQYDCRVWLGHHEKLGASW